MHEALIWIVDDEPGIRDLVQLLLTEAGFQTRQFSRGDKMLQALKEETIRPDLILLDLRMPRLPGTEVLKQLRSMDSTQDVPVLVISGSLEVSPNLDMDQIQGYMVKPFDIDLLLMTVKSLLRRPSTSY